MPNTKLDRRILCKNVHLSTSLPIVAVTRCNTRVHFIHPLKERIVREVGYGLSLEGASAADLVKSMQAKSEPVAQKGKVA
jgi:hypothetical protein